MDNTLTEGQLRYKREREQETIEYQRSLYERAIARQEREKEALKPKVLVDQKAEAMRIHQAGVDKQKSAQVAAQVAAKDSAENSTKYFAELKQQQTAPKPEEERYLCPTCGDPVTPGQAFHRRGDPMLFDYCVIDPRKAMATGRWTREQLINLGFTL